MVKTMKANETTEKVLTPEVNAEETKAKKTTSKAAKATKTKAADAKAETTTKAKAPAKSKKAVVKMSAADKIREMSLADIAKRVDDLKHELYTLRFQAAVGKLENTAQLRKVKKEIARLYTIQTEKQNAAAGK
ncbi:MAG: 50S ribosomal protein L29 [Bacilli bacterium]